MTDNEIIEFWKNEIEYADFADENYINGIGKCVVQATFDLINRLQAKYESAVLLRDYFAKSVKEQKDTIDKQEAEIERLTNKCDDCAGCTQWKCDCSNIEIQAYEKFAEEYKDQIKNYTGMFTDFGFMVNLEAVLNAVDFIRDKLVGGNND